MKVKNYFYPESKIIGHTHCDGSIAFYTVVNSLITNRNSVLIDVGCGRGAYFDKKEEVNQFKNSLRNFRGRVKKVIGLDVDKEALENPSIDEFRLLEKHRKWPLKDNSVDYCISDYVLEHIDDPAFFFSELYRVLKPNGQACFRTVNMFGYVGMMARLIPNKLHSKTVNLVQEERKEIDVFPTIYKCNTKKKLTKILKKEGFVDLLVYTYEPEPSYMSFSSIAYTLGVGFQKIAPSFLKNVLFAYCKKPQ